MGFFNRLFGRAERFDPFLGHPGQRGPHWAHDPRERERLERERYEHIRRYGVAPPVGGAYPAVLVAPPAAPTGDDIAPPTQVAPPTGDGGGGGSGDDMGFEDTFHER